MKQRLLLALLVLFASVGSMWGQGTLREGEAGAPESPNNTTFKPESSVQLKVTGIPSGKKITVGSVTSNGSGTSYTFDIAAGNSIDIVPEEGATYTGLEFNGQVSNVTLAHASLATVSFKNNGGKLGTSDLTISSAVLTKLECEDCGLTELPEIVDGNLGGTMTLNVKNNKISNLSLPSGIAEAHAMTILVDGNSITNIPTASDNVTVTWGTQNLTFLEQPIANEYFSVWTKLVKDEIFEGLSGTDAITDISKVSVSWSKTVKTNNAGDVVFYGGSTYNYGDIKCTIKHKAKASSYPTYVYSMTVDPAVFGLTMSVGDGGRMADPSTEGKVTQGSVLTFAPTAKEGFVFDKYTDVKGLKVSASNPNQFEVVGDGENPNVTINATFKALQYKVIHSGGANGSYKIKVDGNEIQSITDPTVTYGKVLIIETSPKTGYKARVKVNDKEITGSEDVFTYTVVKTTESAFATTAKDVEIEVFFEASVYTLKINKNEGLDKLVVNGNEVSTISTQDKTVTALQPGSIVTLSATLKPGYSLQSILLGTQPLETKANISFEMPESDAIITYNTITKPKLVLTPVSKKYTYTGTAQDFEYTVSTEGETGFTVKYFLNDVETKPISANTYKVKITRAETENYQAVNKEFEMEINKATPVIETKPTVTVPNGSVNYTVTGGTVKLGTKSLMNTGKFTVTSDGTNDIVNNVCQTNVSHIATVTFTVTGTEKDNFNLVSTQVAVKYHDQAAIPTVKIDWKGLPSDMILTVKDKDAEIKKGSSVAVGTTVTITLKYPKGYTGVTLKENKAGATDILDGATEGTEGTLVTLTNDYTIVAGMETLKVSYSGKAATEKYQITLGTIEEQTFDGTAKLIDKNDVTVKVLGYDITDETTLKIADVINAMTITYKDADGKVVGSPIDAGKYTVCVKIASLLGKDYTVLETTEEFKDALVIKKGTITIADGDWPTNATVGVGQTLDKAVFIGGSAPVAGKFAFVDGTIKPTDGQSYTIKYVPESSNYNELSSSKEATVKISNLRVLSIDKVENGTVTVVGNDGVTYKSGEALPEAVTSIQVSTTPATGYKLATLTVNGTAISDGGSYTVGTSSVTISATFEEIKEFTVSVSTSVKGIELVLPSSNVVKKGASYSFSVKGLAADLANLVVSDGTNIYTGTNGAYTISNITANKTITVTMKAGTAPTQVEAVIEANLSTQGKSMGTVTVTKNGSLRADAVDSSIQKFYYGDKIRVTATPADGCRFAGWEGRTETISVIDVVITETSYKFKAVFAGSPTGAEVIEGVDIYGSNGEIVVKCDGAARITIVSMNGQSKQQEISGDTRIPAGAGIYGIVFEQGNNVMRTKVAVK